ncbi:4-hydroxybenzoate octaprenyltransferase [Suttonella sp. R2A3]|uniref:4-hydroxybenzoate octaprenyltransferase n=1 Tax=Suttonella sp. R2A3 TaxID=2908648 RepID=UPI001F40D670|nr:4-hydroxybenzoate octaprenyltransferase [Suttonella sp. R2A3]UJF25304.1 4-hydroxybenzoate octaprenyltransferase [Suttonella sp. R2A3]
MSQRLLNKLSVYARLMRLERPVGTLLLAWSSLWGLWLAGAGEPPARIVLIILLGTWTMRSAGCVFNDLADRNFDGKVQRTTHRPLATGEATVNEALALGVGLLAVSFMLVLLLNWQSVVLSVFCAAVAIIYPFCKRFLPTPQAMLGVAFASAILIAHTAILGKITWAGLFLFLASVFWALVYDTYYGLVDRDDDIPLGLKSAAIFASGREHLFIGSMAALMVLCLLISGALAGLNGWYYFGVLAAALLMVYQLHHTRSLERERCFQAFSHNNWVGAAVLLGLVLAYLP